MTEKMKDDGQKEEYKARIIVKGYQEMIDPQSDSPTALRKSAKLFYSITANKGFLLRAISIRATFRKHRSQKEPLVSHIFYEF